MAYAAVTSLKYTIYFLQYSSHLSMASSTHKLLQYAYESAEWLQKALQNYDQIKNSSHGVMAVEARIRDVARKLEDSIESEAAAQFLSQPQGHGDGRLSLNLHHLSQDFISFAGAASQLDDEYIEELHNIEDAADDAGSGSGDLMEHEHEHEHDMVGLSDQFLSIRKALIDESERSVATLRGMADLYFRESERITVTISGMAGIGKTTLARKLFDDYLVGMSFDHRVFVTVGQSYDLQAILKDILAQLNVDIDDDDGDDEDLVRYILSDAKYFIVFDDVWDIQHYCDNIESMLPHEDNGSRILVICREKTAALAASEPYFAYEMRFLNQEESWELLREKVFGDKECPYQFEKAGRKIADKCEGLPLVILKVADALMSRAHSHKDLEYWNAVADKKNSVFEDTYHQMSQVLLPSYHYIPQNLKACFLYMASFPPDYIVRCSKLINLWRAERFLEFVFRDTKIPLSSKFYDFVSTNLVVVRQRSMSSDNFKACNLHSSYRYYCKRQVEENKFLHILDHADDSVQLRESTRILAIYKSILFAIKEVHHSIASFSTLRSVLCTGPYHQYPVPICLDHWRLLRVLDALTIRFYEFPLDVVKLIRLHYLALTCNANLPRSISKLWNLECLILHQHLSIKESVVQSYVPVDIWNLKGLKYLQIMGRNLPDPPRGETLPRLKKLLDVGAQSCSKRVLESIPNLKKLRIQIFDLGHDDAQTFDHLSNLYKLKSLQIFVLNPEILCEPIVPSPSLSISISSLSKLSLSGFGYPWEDMRMIAEMPNLEALKLQCYAFRGEKWEVEDGGFSKLSYLLIEDTDLVQWTVGFDTFPYLLRLTMKNCYTLQDIPRFSSYLTMELVDCNPIAETCAKRSNNYVSANYSWK